MPVPHFPVPLGFPFTGGGFLSHPLGAHLCSLFLQVVTPPCGGGLPPEGLWPSPYLPFVEQILTVIQYRTVQYDILPLSPMSGNLLAQVKRKLLVWIWMKPLFTLTTMGS
uniref:Uncharacterized protein n=1 Tax=Mus spicilegus TaxID=10103 RepID=A0A8C6HS52_MUSSI